MLYGQKTENCDPCETTGGEPLQPSERMTETWLIPTLVLWVVMRSWTSAPESENVILCIHMVGKMETIPQRGPRSQYIIICYFDYYLSFHCIQQCIKIFQTNQQYIRCQLVDKCLATLISSLCHFRYAPWLKRFPGFSSSLGCHKLSPWSVCAQLISSRPIIELWPANDSTYCQLKPSTSTVGGRSQMVFTWHHLNTLPAKHVLVIDIEERRQENLLLAVNPSETRWKGASVATSHIYAVWLIQESTTSCHWGDAPLGFITKPSTVHYSFGQIKLGKILSAGDKLEKCITLKIMDSWKFFICLSTVFSLVLLAEEP